MDQLQNTQPNDSPEDNLQLNLKFIIHSDDSPLDLHERDSAGLNSSTQLTEHQIDHWSNQEQIDIPKQKDFIYKLNIIQQPVQCRMCGTSTKKRRAIEPFPIVQVKRYFKHDVQLVEDQAFYDNEGNNLILRVSLWQEDKSKMIQYSRFKSLRPYTFIQDGNTEISYDPNYYNLDILYGNLVQTSHLLPSPQQTDEIKEAKGHFFLFPDISVRDEGKFRLKFTLFDLNQVFNKETIGQDLPSSVSLTSEFTKSFVSYSQKSYPGVMNSTEITRWFSKFQVKVPIRNSENI